MSDNTPQREMTREEVIQVNTALRSALKAADVAFNFIFKIISDKNSISLLGISEKYEAYIAAKSKAGA